MIQTLPEQWAVLVFAGADKGAQGEVLFVQFQAAQHLSGLGILNQQRLDQRGRDNVQRHNFFVSADRNNGAMATFGCRRECNGVSVVD